MIHFEHPFMLLLCLCAVPTTILTVTLLNRIKKAYHPAEELPAVISAACIRLTAWAAAWLCLCAGAAVPLWGTRQEAVFRQGHSVVFAVDISRSMTVNDLPPTRLDFAKQYLEFILSHLKNTACALVTVKGSGVLSVPLTFEHFSLTTALQQLSPHTVTDTGTNLEHGIKTALSAFPPKRLERKIIILCTDGDETAGSLMQAVPRLKEEQVTLIIAGFGTTEGGTLSILDENGQKTVKKIPLKEPPLEAVAAALDNGSMYINAAANGSAWHILNAVKKSAYSSENIQYVEKPVRRVFECTLLALVFFCSGFLGRFRMAQNKKNGQIAIRRLLFGISVPLFFMSCTPKQRIQITHARGVLAAHSGHSNTAIAQFASAEAQARKLQDPNLTGYASFSLAAVYLLQNEAEAAVHKLKNIPENADERLKALQWYQQGMIAFGEKNYTDAADCFKQSLLLYSTDIAAKKNYELCRRLCVVQEKTAQKPATAQAQSAETAKNEAVLQVIRKKEQMKWKNVPQEETAAVNDY